MEICACLCMRESTSQKFAKLRFRQILIFSTSRTICQIFCLPNFPAIRYRNEGQYTKPHPSIFYTLGCSYCVERCRNRALSFPDSPHEQTFPYWKRQKAGWDLGTRPALCIYLKFYSCLPRGFWATIWVLLIIKALKEEDKEHYTAFA